MLKTLVKYEFQATGRWMFPLCALTILLALSTRFTMGWIRDAGTGNETLDLVLSGLAQLLMMAFVVSLAAVMIAAVIIMVLRFRNNLLGDEGHVMFTLPVSIHQLVGAKIINTFLWFCLAILADFLALVSAIFGTFWDVFPEALDAFQRFLASYGSGNTYSQLTGWLILAEVLLLGVVVCVQLCLEIYAPLSIGHSFDKHKMLLSVVIFFAIQGAFQLVSSVGLMAFGNSSLFDLADRFMTGLSPAAVAHLGLWFAILVTALWCAVLYAVTHYMLKHKLNLE